MLDQDRSIPTADLGEIEPPATAEPVRLRSRGLTDTAIRTAKPRQKAYKLWDNWGLYLLIQPETKRRPEGSKLWRYKYTLHGKPNTHALGRYPDVSLAQARQRLLKARGCVAAGQDPNKQRRVQRCAQEASRETTVEGFAAALFAPPKETGPIERIGSREIRNGRPRTPKWSAERGRLKNYIGPAIGKRPIADVVGDEVWRIIDKALRAGQPDLAERLKVDCNRIWRAAVLAKKCAHNIVADLPVVKVPKSKHRPAILIPRRYGDLLRAIDGYTYQTEVSTRYLLKILPHIALRSAEIRWARWTMIDFEAAELRLPPEIMKLPDVHIVPLSCQVRELFCELHEYTGNQEFFFPGNREGRPLSENTVNIALAIMGFKGEMTGHGTRRFFSTQLHEHQWPHDAIEIQIAHLHRSEVSAAYDSAKHLPVRRLMVQWWSDYLDSLRGNAKKPPLPYKEVSNALAKERFMYVPVEEVA